MSNSQQNSANIINQPQIAFEDNPNFNEWLNGKFARVVFKDDELGEFSYDAADVIYKTDYKNYEELLDAYNNSEEAEDVLRKTAYLKLKNDVCGHYPPLIAYACSRVYSSRNYKEKLERLRDVWESAVYVMYALIIAEYRALGLNFKQAGIASLARLLDEGIKNRLETIDKLLDYAKQNGKRLACKNLLSVKARRDIEELNKLVRNEFSHIQSLSEGQAKTLFLSVLPKVKSALEDLKTLEKIGLMRWIGSKGSVNDQIFEEFYGAELEPRDKNINIADNKYNSWRPKLQDSYTLIEVKEKLWITSPFIYIKFEDTHGHRSEIHFLKRKKGTLNLRNLDACQLQFEAQDSSNQEEITAKQFKQDFQELDSLF